ncbi:MAG: iron-containing alcohol dehydrogenase [Bacillota bacterium]
MKTDFFEFFCPTRILAGQGVVDSLGQSIESMGWSRCFLVTDQVLRNAGLADRVVEALEGGNIRVVGIFDEVVPNSEVSLVERGAALAGEAGPDFLLALGGGSNIDTAKAINIILSNGGSLLDYEGFGLLSSPLTPLVAVPTTAGTGSEVTQFAVIKDDSRQAKLSFLSPYLVPNVAVLDPEMTVGMPPLLTATTGLDALTHAVEAHVSSASNPVASGLALEAARIIFQNLPAATARGDDLEARHAMLVASTMAGMAFSSAMVGIVHAMSHACGGLYNVPHGLANAILLPYGMEYNIQSSASQLADIARAAGAQVSGLTAEEGAARAVEAVRNLCVRCGITQSLKDTGVPAEGLPGVADLAALDGAIFNNPGPAEPDDILELLKKAY